MSGRYLSNEMDPIRRYQMELRDLHETAEGLRPILNSCNDAVARSQLSGTFMLQTVGRYVRIEVLCMVDHLQEITALIRELAKEGLRSKEKEHVDSDMLGIPTRRYKIGEHVIVCAVIVGKSCRRIQTGTTEVPTYDIVCGDEVDAEAPVPAINGEA